MWPWGLASIWTCRRVILWQVVRGSFYEVFISCPRAGFVLHVDWGIRRLPRGRSAHPRFDYPCGRFLGDPSLQGTPDCLNSTDAPGEHHALSRTDRLSRIPSNRDRLVVPDVKLPAAGVSRPAVASRRVFVFASDNAGVRMDDEYAAAHSGH
jgi:hypothetical protein